MDKAFKDIEFSVNGLDYILSCSALDNSGSPILLYVLMCVGEHGKGLFTVSSNHIYYFDDLERLEFSRGEFNYLNCGQIYDLPKYLGQKIMECSREHDEYILSCKQPSPDFDKDDYYKNISLD